MQSILAGSAAQSRRTLRPDAHAMVFIPSRVLLITKPYSQLDGLTLAKRKTNRTKIGSFILTLTRHCSCIKNEASHHERHSAIARLVIDLHSGDDAGPKTPIRNRKKVGQQESGDDLSTHDEGTATDVSSNDLRTPDEDLGGSLTAGERSMSPSERRAFKKATKDKKNQEIAFRNQQKFVLPVSQAQVDQVARVIHGPQYNVDGLGGHPKTQEADIDDTIDRDDSYTSAIKDHRSWLIKQMKVSRARDGRKGADAWKTQQEEDVQDVLSVKKQDMELVVAAILTELGVLNHDDAHPRVTGTGSQTPNRSRKHKASTILQLRKEISADIEKSENDFRARQQRMEGYWRYINGTVTNRLVDNAQAVDRATGVRLKHGGCCQRSQQVLDIDHAEDLEMEAKVDHDEGTARQGSIPRFLNR